VSSNKALIKHELLGWARNRARVTLDDAAKVANVEPETLERWEAGDGAPTVSQLRILAGKYHFPLAVFYLPKPPTDFAPLRDFRRLPNANDRTISAELALHIRDAHQRRELALELHDDLGEPVRPFRLRATLNESPEAVGEEVRKFFDVTDADQRKAAREDRPFDFWRRKLEERDILVFVIGGPHNIVDTNEMRGFAIARHEIPVIVINGRDHSKGGKCFTLLHELAHVLLGESALTNGDGGTAEEQRIERFCDAVAAAALMPRELMFTFAQVKPAGERQWNDDELRTLAKAIGVSREAFLLRLVTIRRASWDFYMGRRRKFRDDYEAAAAAEALAPKDVKIKRSILLMSWNGRGYTRLVLRSYYDQRITLNDVSSYLGAKVKHIPALERAAFQTAE